MMKKLTLPIVKKAIWLLRRHGAPLLWERFVRRKQILVSAPVACTPGAPLEVHMQVCSRDWLNAIWTLKSLRAQGRCAFDLRLYLDCNVPPQVRPIFESHFPGIQIPEADWLDKQVRKRLAPIAPAMAALWRARYSPTFRKMVNAWICARNDRFLYLDPDVLFFAPPAELLAFAAKGGEGSTLGLFNATAPPPETLTDCGAFCLDEAEVSHACHLKLPRDFNAGVGMIRREAVDWPFLEGILGALPWVPNRTLLLDQTCLALLAARSGWERLNYKHYLVGEGRVDNSTVAAHYVAWQRDLFYVEGIPKLRRQNLFRRLESLPRLTAAATADGAPEEEPAKEFA